MHALSWWLRAVGAVYLLLGLTFLPFLNTHRVLQFVPGFDGQVAGPAWNGFVDYLFMFGLEEIVLGAFLIVASFRPAWFTPLVWLLCALSVVRGIGHDLYMLANGYSVLTNVLFIALHLTIVVSGLLLLRRARRGVAGEPAARLAEAR